MVTLSRPSRAAGAADCEFASDTGSHGGRRGGPGARTWTAIPVFTDQATGRGQLLYSRYDGNLGLITPTGDGVADGLA